MNKSIIITLISDDKPGIVEQLAKEIRDHHGNWLESQMAQLQGKFAGVIRCSAPATSTDKLLTALRALSTASMHVVAEEVADTPVDQSDNLDDCNKAHIRFTGPDQEGIVKEITSALAAKQINLRAITTTLSSMPYSGEPLFIAEAEITIPNAVDSDVVFDELIAIADQLGLDFERQHPE